MRTWFWIALTVVALGFWIATYRVTRRLRRARTELQRLRYYRALAHAYELERVADERILGIGG